MTSPLPKCSTGFTCETLAHGLEWHHLPIRHLSAPDELLEDRCANSGMRLCKLLSQGENVVILCILGLARMGTTAARLPVKFGAAPNSAIRKVREARPGSIGIPEQAEFFCPTYRIILSHCTVRVTIAVTCYGPRRDDETGWSESGGSGGVTDESVRRDRFYRLR